MAGKFFSSLFAALVIAGSQATAEDCGVAGPDAYFCFGDTFKELKLDHAEGVELTVATSGIGMLGYNSRIPIIDLVGLTDAHVAHQKLKKRGRPGHEKRAEKDSLLALNTFSVRTRLENGAEKARR